MTLSFSPLRIAWPFIVLPTADGVVIRRAQPEDAAAVAAIYRYYVEETTISFELVAPDEEVMRGRILAIVSAGFPYYVWEEGAPDGEKEILGYCCAHPWKERPAYADTLETTLYLAPVAQGRGIGRALMQRLITDCCALGVHALIACITAENTRSCRFHERLGFIRVSLFPEVGYKQGKRLDVADYELLLQARKVP